MFWVLTHNWHELWRLARHFIYDSLSLAECQIKPIHVNFHIQKRFRHFWYKFSWQNLVLGSFGFQWCGFHLCAFSKTSLNVQLVWFFTTVVKEFLHPCVFESWWLKCCRFGFCGILPDLKRCTSQGTGVCKARNNKGQCLSEI